MDDLFQRPLAPISIILNFSKIVLVKAEITHSFHQKKWEVLMKIEAISVTDGLPPGFFRVDEVNFCLFFCAWD